MKYKEKLDWLTDAIDAYADDENADADELINDLISIVQSDLKHYGRKARFFSVILTRLGEQSNGND